MSASLKLRQFESKLAALHSQHQNLLKERQQEITAFLTSLDLASLDDPLLIGGLLFLKEKVSTQDPIKEVWRTAGEKFLRRTQSKKVKTPQRDSVPRSTR